MGVDRETLSSGFLPSSPFVCVFPAPQVTPRLTQGPDLSLRTRDGTEKVWERDTEIRLVDRPEARSTILNSKAYER